MRLYAYLYDSIPSDNNNWHKKKKTRKQENKKKKNGSQRNSSGTVSTCLMGSRETGKTGGKKKRGDGEIKPFRYLLWNNNCNNSKKK